MAEPSVSKARAFLIRSMVNNNSVSPKNMFKCPPKIWDKSLPREATGPNNYPQRRDYN
ncbi:hypothetical protein M7I_0685 [Glarea lozoyensis 74030]|uniref:Uncharacterized protein n=1 Tax=Glarea lozoyensis (strain ATCC 74030 / MF5533) TaxID=1104152 RepID=H0EE17_GLAL7|nr:hypothetical protein M7I_0685 [Glarea lozoyensis 74030]